MSIQKFLDFSAASVPVLVEGFDTLMIVKPCSSLGDHYLSLTGGSGLAGLAAVQPLTGCIKLGLSSVNEGLDCENSSSPS